MRLFINIVFIGLLTFILSGCDKTPPIEPEPQPFGTVEAKLNGKDWKASMYYYHNYSSYIKLSSNLYENGYHRHSLTITIPRKLGTFDIVQRVPGDTSTIAQTDFYTSIAHGDVPGNSYLLDTTLLSPVLSVTKYVAGTEELEGTFQIGFTRDTSLPKWDTTMSDTIILKDGYFHTRLSASGVFMD